MADTIIPESAVGIPAATVSFRATLTKTSNQYLIPRLPVDGFVLIGERDIEGNCTRVTFMPDPEAGEWTGFVTVPDAEFTFTSKV